MYFKYECSCGYVGLDGPLQFGAITKYCPECDKPIVPITISKEKFNELSVVSEQRKYVQQGKIEWVPAPPYCPACGNANTEVKNW